eukprot:3133509-Rhodomonas_salina.2
MLPKARKEAWGGVGIPTEYPGTPCRNSYPGVRQIRFTLSTGALDPTNTDRYPGTRVGIPPEHAQLGPE